MNKHVEQLNLAREQLIVEQGSLYSQIISLSTDPEKTAILIHQITDNALRYNEITRAHAESIRVVSNTPFWVRPFMNLRD